MTHVPVSQGLRMKYRHIIQNGSIAQHIEITTVSCPIFKKGNLTCMKLNKE